MSEAALKGIHHVTAMTDDAERNYQFVTGILGMRLVKKTINQDDIHTYHTYYADDRGNPGTNLTFFDFPNAPSFVSGTNSISRTGLRFPDDAALEYYLNRFEESDGQRYQLFSDESNEGVAPGVPWKNGPLPQDKAIYGLGPIEITVSCYEDFIQAMQSIYDFRILKKDDQVTLLEVGQGGQMIVRKDETSQVERQGNGTVHHVSFRVEDHEAIKAWEEKYNKIPKSHSGIIDRFYFEALYTRIGPILIELSTDGPGFIDDQESYEELGTGLALPPEYKRNRKRIESLVRPFDTSDINEKYKH